MSAEAPVLTRSFRVGKRWTVEVSVPPIQPGAMRSLAMEWSPAFPQRKLTRQEFQQYREGRDAVIAELSRELGISIAVIDL